MDQQQVIALLMVIAELRLQIEGLKQQVAILTAPAAPPPAPEPEPAPAPEAAPETAG